MFLEKNITAIKHEKTNFLLLFSEQNYVEDNENVTLAAIVIYNSHTFPL